MIEVRNELDCLYDEKLMIVKKMYNLGQKFVQELEVQNIEQLKHIHQSENIKGVPLNTTYTIP
jgi:hypothetical protein